MAIFTMPILLMIEADNFEEAQKAIDDWANEVELDNDLPVGTEDINITPEYECNDEGMRVLYLPCIEDDEDILDVEEDEETDDFNDAEDDDF